MKPKSPHIGFAERLGDAIDELRYWLVHSWRLASLMAKGAYLVGERKRLFRRLGEEVYYKMAKGELANADLEPLVNQLGRLTKKVEIEEMLIRGIRFGEQRSRRLATTTDKEPS